MKKFGYVVAALGAIAVAVPSIASAETVVDQARRSSSRLRTRSRAEVPQVHRDSDRLAPRRWHHH